jgi:VanZ family protein
VWATRFFRSSFSSFPSSVLLVFFLVLVLILVDSLYQQPSASPMPCFKDLLNWRSHFAVLFGLHLLTCFYTFAITSYKKNNAIVYLLEPSASPPCNDHEDLLNKIIGNSSYARWL